MISTGRRTSRGVRRNSKYTCDICRRAHLKCCPSIDGKGCVRCIENNFDCGGRVDAQGLAESAALAPVAAANHTDINQGQLDAALIESIVDDSAAHGLVLDR